MTSKNPFPVSPDREKDKKIVMRKLLLYGYVTHYKGTKKVRISQHGLL